MILADLPQTATHPFYRRLNELLEKHGFDKFAEQRCEKFYAARMGRPLLTPGSYLRCLLIGCLEGIDSERGIAWRLVDSISLRRFLAIEAQPRDCENIHQASFVRSREVLLPR